MTFLYLCSDQLGSGESEFGRKLLEMFLDKLLIGQVGTMDQTVQVMAHADTIIRP